MNSGRIPFNFPTGDTLVPIIEEHEEPAEFFPEVERIYSEILDPTSNIKLEDPEIDQTELELIGKTVLEIVHIVNSGRYLGVDKKFRPIIYQHIPQSRRNIHHIFQQADWRSGNYLRFPLYNILEPYLTQRSPYSRQDFTLLENVNSLANLIEMLKSVHMRVHGGRKPISEIKTQYGPVEVHEFLLAFCVFNILDRHFEIDKKLRADRNYLRSAKIRVIYWQLNLIRDIGVTIMNQRPELYYAWYDTIYRQDPEGVLEQ